MINLNASIIIEFIFGLSLWWVAIYLITQNPFSRIVQLAFGVLATMSFYFSADIFFFAANSTANFSLDATILKSFIWSLYLPFAFLCHASLLLAAKKMKSRLWQRVSLPLAYFLTLGVIGLEAFTNLTRNYPKFYEITFTGNLGEVSGNYFWLIGIFFFVVTGITLVNFSICLKGEKKGSPDWYKFLWPWLGVLLSIILAPFVLLGYTGIIPHSDYLSMLSLAVIVIPLTYSILRYSLFIDDSKIIFGRNFLYSTVSIGLIFIAYFLVLRFFSSPFDSVWSLILPFSFAYLLIGSHPVYVWVSTFIRDIIYNVPSGYSVVNDDEVYEALKDCNRPDRLENSSLLRLNIVASNAKKESSTPVDSLRKVLREAIEYFKSDDGGRSKQSLKYELLRMIAKQAEEGQILWELGFEEYPVRIMTRETRARPPKFKSTSPSEYIYTSRNAYLALKREAIHDVTWRISYLEKLSKK